MNTAEQVLVILLGVALAALLILAITAAVYVIRLVQTLRRIAASAEHVIHSAQSIADVVRTSATPIGAFAMVKNLIEMVAKAKRKKEK